MTVTRAKFFELKIQEILTPYYIGSNANLFDIKGKEMDKYPQLSELTSIALEIIGKPTVF